jgi:hypothetical protein
MHQSVLPWFADGHVCAVLLEDSDFPLLANGRVVDISAVNIV